MNESAILDYIDGRAASRAEIEAHLDTCDECRQLVAELARTSLAAGPWQDGTPTQPQRAHGLPETGALLAGRYRIGQALGHGAMGMVYEAVDEALGSTIAVKVFWPHLGEDPRVLESIRREANLGRRIQHPNVRRVFDVATAGAITFLTMELVDGETLEARLTRGPLSEEEAVRTVLQVCDALTAAHAAGIVHRDLKPGNIAIDKSDRVIVMDFGLARDVNAQASRNQGRGLVGTPAYWSPEQARGEPATPASDIYSLGLIAYRLLTGEGFSLGGENRLPPKYRRVVDRCVEHRPNTRYASAAAVRRAFEDARGAGRKRATGGAIVLAAVVVLAAATLAMRARTPAPATREPRIDALTSAPKEPAPMSLAAPADAARAVEVPSLPVDALPSAARSPNPPSSHRQRPARVASPTTAPASTNAPAVVEPHLPRQIFPEEVPRKPTRPKRQIDREDPYSNQR